MSKNFPVNDVAVAITKRPIKFHMNVWPICLIRTEVDLSGYRALVAGWGVTEYQGVRPASLLDGQVRILSEEECQAAKYIGRVYNSDQMICASSEKTDACQGDSGGPLIVYGSSGNAIQVGIVSFGFGCQTKDSAGVYTRLSKYLDWIDEVTGRTESCILPRDYKNELV
ncbi:unnamed protein product [Hermetia illucens]|uniref:Peptidase S1 domain-containing protein n=2 Tax=Hermetia illucens TaxID=343691 RepID=A0A7R8YXF3_HERIL|nr:unnamed protein product [Hermetia illucens]